MKGDRRYIVLYEWDPPPPAGEDPFNEIACRSTIEEARKVIKKQTEDGILNPKRFRILDRKTWSYVEE